MGGGGDLVRDLNHINVIFQFTPSRVGIHVFVHQPLQ